MDKKEIIARLHGDPTSLPTLEEVSFIMEDNKRETLELSERILKRAEECHSKGEEYSWSPDYCNKFFELENQYREANVELWDHQNKTEVEWLKVRGDLETAFDGAGGQEKFYTALLEIHDESQMTKH